ncbi:hypothetical protein LC55x_2216 [Lysobacter capsici]|uniref:Uncharacterized protein n=1 Tax=Lysobacter capsici AZ78 TaxID=1444315 RepID=A0A108U6D4_9GAMM|nr:hypothetical protein LC55x_2216 [Lysobacter capsici]KWS03362.1 hypothetical protein AZ78_0908 [Lysobacter capsici AZ78]
MRRVRIASAAPQAGRSVGDRSLAQSVNPKPTAWKVVNDPPL